MENEYKKPSSNSIELIQGYLKVALIKLLRNKEIGESKVSGVSDSTYGRFMHVVQNYHPISNVRVSDVASNLNVSPQHLNSVLKKTTGKSASELINEQVIMEAKRYLLHTDKTVSEIAFELSFADPSHFVKHFRKSTGQTPQAFRKRHFQ
jgi:AraC-like DNA-binding protein